MLHAIQGILESYSAYVIASILWAGVCCLHSRFERWAGRD